MNVTYQYLPIWKVLSRGKPYEPFWYQAQHIHAQVDRGCKRIICAWGRRAGKSAAVVAEVAREVIKAPANVRGIDHSPIVYIVGPNAEASMRIWEPVWAAFVPPDDGSFVPPLGFLHDWHDKQRGVIGIKGGARVYRKTGESPAAVQGERVTLVVTDETQDMPDDVWQYLMPGLLESEGTLIAIGVAKGRGRFRSYWHLGQDPESDFYSSSVPSTANPVIQDLAEKSGIPIEEWLRKSAEEDLSDAEFQQQYLAKWVDADGQVFNKFDHLFTGSGIPTPHARHIMSLDLGKIDDFTVAYVGDAQRETFVAKERFNKIDYMDQVPRIADLYHAYDCSFIHMDTNGPGEAPSEMLRSLGCRIIPFTWSNSSKQALISVMVREVERGNVTFLASDDVLKKEMGLFEGTVKGNTVRYEAPKGYHDDAVIAAALLIQKMVKLSVRGSKQQFSYLEAAHAR